MRRYISLIPNQQTKKERKTRIAYVATKSSVSEKRITKQEQARGRRKVSLVSEFVYKKKVVKIVRLTVFSYRPIDDDIDGATDPCR